MNKIFLIIQREYLSKARKRSFIIMTILGPLLMASIFVFSIYMATRQDEKLLIQVKDDTGLFFSKFENNQNYTFIEVTGDLEATKDTLKKRGDYMLLHIPATKLSIPDKAVIYSDQQPTMSLKDYIASRMSKELEKQTFGRNTQGNPEQHTRLQTRSRYFGAGPDERNHPEKHTDRCKNHHH